MLPVDTRNKSQPTTIEFGLHPNKKLFLTLHRKISINPHKITQTLSSLPNNANHAHYALMDATRIISLNHIAVAANSALMRPSQHNGAALEVIVHAAGSTNVGAVLKDYAFDAHSKAAAALENDSVGSGTQSTYDVILLGFDVEEEDYRKIMDQVGLEKYEEEQDMHSFFERERTREEITRLIKLYKTTKEEVDMQGIERAILNRVASKYHI